MKIKYSGDAQRAALDSSRRPAPRLFRKGAQAELKNTIYTPYAFFRIFDYKIRTKKGKNEKRKKNSIKNAHFYRKFFQKCFF